VSGMLGFDVPVILTREDDERLREWLVVQVSAGYCFRPAFRFDVLVPEKPDRPPADYINRAPVDFGKLSMSGIVYRLGLTFRL